MRVTHVSIIATVLGRFGESYAAIAMGSRGRYSTLRTGRSVMGQSNGLLAASSNTGQITQQTLPGFIIPPTKT